MNDPTQHGAPGSLDERFTFGLVADVFEVLNRHGYRQGNDRAVGTAYGLLGDLVRAYEGGAA